MSDFCGLWANGSLAITRADIAGDFLADLERLEKNLQPGCFVPVGVCEGHGSGVGLVRDPRGGLWLVHVPMGRKKPKGMPDWVELPRPG